MKQLYFLCIILITFSIYGCKHTTKKTDGPNNTTNNSSNSDEKNIKKDKSVGAITGKYAISIGNFKGIIIINKTQNLYSGTIQFPGWGKGLPQPMKKLRIKGRKIYFIRSIENYDEMKKYGSSRFFTQKFYGVFNKTMSKIRGRFVDAGTESMWEAIPIRE